MELALQFIGAIGILVPFALVQFQVTTTRSWWYLWLNFFGASILTVLALLESQWGFVLLQGVWALSALLGVARKLRRPTPPSHVG